MITGKLIDGGFIFKMVSEQGLPLEIINMQLREKQQAFNIEQFIQAAKKGGWTAKRVSLMLNDSTTNEVRSNINFQQALCTLIEKTYGE